MKAEPNRETMFARNALLQSGGMNDVELTAGSTHLRTVVSGPPEPPAPSAPPEPPGPVPHHDHPHHDHHDDHHHSGHHYDSHYDTPHYDEHHHDHHH